jgi:nitrite reductase/ring-hydroxylating ferredoxin subunit/uncharacterized membrane protein
LPASAKFLDALVDRVERLASLDKPSDAVAGLLRKVIRPGPIEDTLSGTPIGHPVHPLLVAVPIGAWTSALVMDLVRADAKATEQAIGIGTLAALPSAITGASDWLNTAGAERRVGLVHAVANYSALGLQVSSLLARRRGRRTRGAALSLAAFGLMSAGGWLGGHLTYALGIGVDTTAFQSLPADWTDAAELSAIGDQPLGVDVGGVPVVLFRTADGIAALADRCTHRGGPLHEGQVSDGCITCPWHGSRFAADGAVQSGPATRPQPRLDTRTVNGRVQIRRDEERTLRTNPIGH